jgi:periplasmic protein TonB
MKLSVWFGVPVLLLAACATAVPTVKDRFVPPSKVARLPEVVSEFVAEYPEEARRLRVQGTVVMRLTVDGTGRVAKVSVIKSADKALDAAAVEALRHFKFKPAIYAGSAVSTEITYSYKFILDGRPVASS